MFRSASLASLIFSATWSVQELTAADSMTYDEDDVIVISATRSEVNRLRSPTVVDVVDQEDLRVQGSPIRTQDQIRYIAGVSIAQNFGGFEGGGGIYIRGSRAYQTQLLLDGVPFNDAASGQGDAGHHLFLLPGLQRIEVAKGAQSGIYGSGASGGAIDLQGLRPTEKQTYGARLEYGSFNTFSGEIQTAGMLSEEFGFAFAANHLSSDGVSAQTASDADGDPDGFEDDEFMRSAFSGRLSWQRDNTEVFANVIYMLSDSDYDSSGPDDDEANIEQDSIRLHGGLRTVLTDYVDLDADLSYTTYDRDYGGDPGNTYESTDLYGSVRGTFAINDSFDLTTAIDYRDQAAEIDAFGTVIDESESIFGVWAQAEVEWEDFTGHAVVRYDDHSREGDASTYRLGMSYKLLDGDWIVHASTGTGFRAPSLFELYSTFGNLELEPEESFSYDIGHRLKIGDIGQFEQTAFYTGWEEAIRWVWVGPGPFDGQYQNVSPDSNAYVFGVENTLDVQPTESFDLRISFTLQDSDDGSADGNQMTRTPNFQGGVIGTYKYRIGDMPAWITLGVEYLGRRYQNSSNTTDLPSMTNVRAAIGLQPTDNITITVRGENITDELEPTNIGTATNWTSVPQAFYVAMEASF